MQIHQVSKTQKELRIFCGGSIHLDILSNVTAFPETVDKLGKMEIEVGGTAYNIAVDLHDLGVQDITFCTALKDSPLSKMLVDKLKTANIKPLVVYDESLPQSGFNAHMIDGEMHSAVSSMAVEYYDFQEAKFVHADLAESSMVILDCNMSVSSLQFLIALATRMKLPTCICAVSQGKSLKIVDVPPTDYVFMNALEHKYLLQHRPEWSPNQKTVLIRTEGEHGASAFRCGEQICRVDAAELIGSEANFLGAGDAYCAGVLFSVLRGFPLEVAMLNASLVSKRVIQSQNCNVGASSLLDEHLQALRSQAELDDLTGLYLRRSGMNFLAEKFREMNAFGTSVSVFFGDLDKFKSINDTYGHDVGDEALRVAAKTMQECLRDTKDMACRWGGEEMVAILPDCDLTSAIRIAERYREILKTKVVEGMERKLTVSVGVATLSEVSCIDDAIKLADYRMYLAKEGGRDRVVSDGHTDD